MNLQIKAINAETRWDDFPCRPLWDYGIMNSRFAKRDAEKHASTEGARIYHISPPRGLPHVIR